MNSDRRRTRFAIDLATLLLLSCIAWRSPNYVSATGYGIDSGVFASSARHILAGKALYKDIFDHKPPLIHAIDTLALGIGGGNIDSIRFVERIFAVAGALLFYAVTYCAFRHRAISFAAAVFFQMHFYQPSSFEGGNVTEEYGAVFALSGMLAALLARNAQEKNRRSEAPCFVSGLSFSLASFTKETFLFTAFPWLLYLTWKKTEGRRFMLRGAAFFLGGALVPFFLVLTCLSATGSISDYLDVISFNMNTSILDTSKFSFPGKLQANYGPAFRSLFGLTTMARILFIIGAISLFSRSFLEKHNYVPLAFAATFVFDYMGSALSGRGYGHYYLQLAPGFVLMGSGAAAFMAYRARMSAPFVLAAALTLVPVMDHAAIRGYAGRLAFPAANGKTSAVSEKVAALTGPGDSVWSPDYLTSVNVETGRLSPTKYLYAFPHVFIDTWKSTRSQKIDAVRRELLKNRPKVIVLRNDGKDLLDLLEIREWYSANYSTHTATESGIEFSIAVRCSSN